MLIELLEASVAGPTDDPTLVLERALEQARRLARARADARAPGRYWVVAPGADRRRRRAAQASAWRRRCGRRRSRGGPHRRSRSASRSAPTTRVDAAGLAAQADLDLYAAHAPVARRRPGGTRRP